eukprot:m.12542 g.12542  ORF g.12542 m.12542 type:complete len:210 (-) comp9972_c0_seq1:129-758(-)
MPKLSTQQLWEKQDRLKGDRHRMLSAVKEVFPAKKVLYPGSYVDLAPSFVFPDVTYADVDKRANSFFRDIDGVSNILSAHDVDPKSRTIEFIHADYNNLELPEQSFDLLVSLYAGFISEPCAKFLRIGGHLLVNPSHGDAAIASISDQFELVGVVLAHEETYSVNTSNLDNYFIPKKKVADLSADYIHRLGRGIAYTQAAFAYVFKRIR